MAQGIPKHILEKAKNVKAIFFDVDGVLTDGSITYSTDGEELKSFNVKDGQIVKHLKINGIVVGAITGRSSSVVERRCKELQLDFFEQGVKDKWEVTKSKMEVHNLENNEVCYIGDDIIDLRVIKNVGLGIAPKDALEYIKAEADYTSSKEGGKGVLREVGDLVLESKGQLKMVIGEYLD